MNLSQTQFIFLVASAVILFLYGLEHFSKEVHRLGETRWKGWLGRVSDWKILGLLLGAGVTAAIQSSSAVSALTVALVNSGVLSFQQSLGIILGANVGTTVTAQLVAFDMMKAGPFLIVLGFFLSLVKFRYSFIGRAIFYFGFIFFSLDLISDSLLPLKQDERVIALLARPTSPVLAALIGMAVTAVLQSSSVTTALVVLLVQQGNLSAGPAIALVLGANVGTTSTALLASIKMSPTARKTALVNFVLNLAGVLLFLPFTSWLQQLAAQTANSPARIVANAHLIFNLSVALLALPLFVLWGKINSRRPQGPSPE